MTRKVKILPHHFEVKNSGLEILKNHTKLYNIYNPAAAIFYKFDLLLV